MSVPGTGLVEDHALVPISPHRLINRTSRQASPALPPIVPREEWQAAREALLIKEEAHTRAGGHRAAGRRRLPMVEMTRDDVLRGERGPARLVDILEGRRQLIVQHSTFRPDRDTGCPGCTFLAGPIDHLPPHLAGKDGTLALISRAPIGKLLAYRAKRGWTPPWYSSFGTTFNEDVGVTIDGQGCQGFIVLRCDGDRVFQPNHVTGRGVELVMSTFKLLDLTAYGSQEATGHPPNPPPSTGASRAAGSPLLDLKHQLDWLRSTAPLPHGIAGMAGSWYSRRLANVERDGDCVEGPRARAGVGRMSMADGRDGGAVGMPSKVMTGRVTRRGLLAGSGAALAGATLAPSGLAQEGTPVTVDPAAFRALCVAVTGTEELDDAGLAQLRDLFLADEEMATQLREVLAMGGGPLNMRELPFPALVIVTNILQFWYLGHFRNDPLENRAERLSNLVSYTSLPYVTIPAVCKEFGYWSIDPGLPDGEG